MLNGTKEQNVIDLPDPVRRIIGDVCGQSPGPCVICLAGIHGNEPAGVIALQRVVNVLRGMKDSLRGEFLAVAGNLAALKAGRRFIDADLNRIWDSPYDMHPVKAGETVERAEQRELRDVITKKVEAYDGPIYFLDMHTTSAETAPFAIISDTLANRAFARRFPIPLILGLEEKKSGTVADYVHPFGAVTMGVEAGRHDDPASIDRHEAAAWLALCQAGCISEKRKEVIDARRLLSLAAENLPRILEIRFRHRVSNGDGFSMRPGFYNFATAREGQLLARDGSGEVSAPQSGHILLPLYQQTGDDGFFIAREVRAIWLTVSAALRKIRADHLAYWMPGVKRHPDFAGVVLVNPSVARWHTVEIFHLLGFRQRNNAPSGQLVFSRRLRDPS